jgi:hypothetical protein
MTRAGSGQNSVAVMKKRETVIIASNIPSTKLIIASPKHTIPWVIEIASDE